MLVERMKTRKMEVEDGVQGGLYVGGCGPTDLINAAHKSGNFFPHFVFLIHVSSAPVLSRFTTHSI